MNENLIEMKKQYENVPIPKELDSVVKNAIKIGGRTNMKKNKNRNKFFAAVTAASVAAIFVISVNTSESFAANIKQVPVIGSIAKVVTFKEFNVKEKTYEAEIKAPAVQGLSDKGFEQSLNQKYLADAQQQYNDFKKDMQYMESEGGGHIGVKSGYDVKTDNDNILAIERYNVSTSNGTSEIKFDTIDKKNNVAITLPSLFKDESYIDAISANIKEQMNARYNKDNSDVYYVSGVNEKLTKDVQVPANSLFDKIQKDQLFYINRDGNLVIVFPKYEVGPGSTGTPEFVIPTSVISNDLVSNKYIK